MQHLLYLSDTLLWVSDNVQITIINFIARFLYDYDS